MASSPRGVSQQPLHLGLIRPGDVLGFSGCNPTSTAIRVCTCGLICCGGLSHVAIVTWWPGRRRGTFPQRPRVLCESTSQADKPCLIQERPVSGVQIHHIRARILAYPGRVWHYPLSRPLDWEQVQQLYRFCRKHLGAPYDYIGAAEARHTPLARLILKLRREDLDEVFCSEFVAACHRKLGLLATDNASRFSPNRLVRTERRRKILGKPRRLK